MRTLVCVLLLALLAAPAQASDIADAGPTIDAGALPQPDNGYGTSPSVDWAATIGGIALALEVVISLVVAATPTKADDVWWARWSQRISILRALNIPNGILGRLSFPGTRPKPGRV